MCGMSCHEDFGVCRLCVGACRLEVAGLFATIAQALLRLLGGTITGEVTLLAAVVALLDSALGAVARHVTDAATGLEK